MTIEKDQQYMSSKKRIFLPAALCLALVLGLTACGQKTVPETSGNADGGQAAAAAAENASLETAEETPGPISLEEQLKLAWNFLTEGNYKEAVLAFTAVIDIDPKNAEAYKGRAESYLGQAEFLLSQGGAGADFDDLTFADYLRLAGEDYDKAVEFSEDAAALRQERKDKYGALFTAALDEGEKALAAGDDEAMFAALQRAAALEPYAPVDPANDSQGRYGRLWADCTTHVQDSRDTEHFHAYCDFLMEMAEMELARGGRLDACSSLQRMVTGNAPEVVFTHDYIEAIDRPILEWAMAHEDAAEDNVSIANIIWNASIALGDLDTARRMFPIKNLHTTYPEGYDVREDGYTITRPDYTQEYDACGRLLSTTINAANGTTTVSTYEYESSGPRKLSEHRVFTGGGATTTTDTTWTYADGQLVSSHTYGEGTVQRPFGEDQQFHYSGWDIDVEITYLDGTGTTEARRAHYDGSYGPR